MFDLSKYSNKRQHILNNFQLISFCLFFRNCYTHDVFIFLSLTFVNKIVVWGALGHYMICKSCSVFCACMLRED